MTDICTYCGGGPGRETCGMCKGTGEGPRPFLRPAVAELSANIAAQLAGIAVAELTRVVRLTAEDCEYIDRIAARTGRTAPEAEALYSSIRTAASNFAGRTIAPYEQAQTSAWAIWLSVMETTSSPEQAVTALDGWFAFVESRLAFDRSWPDNTETALWMQGIAAAPAAISWNPAAYSDDPDHWSRVLGADYAGVDCKNCKRARVLHYAEVARLICEKCNWDQVTDDYATDHDRIG